jgi:uncharacterized protein
MTCALRVCDGLPPDWDELAAGAPPSVSRRWVNLAADRFPAGYRTFELRAGGATLAALGGTVLARPHASPRVDPYRILAGHSAGLGLIPAGPHPWRGLGAADVMPCALLMYPNYDLFPVGPAARDPAALDCLVRHLCAWAGREGLASLAFLYLTPRGGALMDALRRAGAQVVPLAHACSLDVTWRDFDGYLATLPQKRRAAVRSELRRLAAQEVTVGAEELGAVAPDLLRLRGQLVVKYGGTPSAERDGRLLDYVRASFTPAEICVVTARRRGLLLGFFLLVQDGDCWTALLTGADYDEPCSRFTYFATGFYTPAALAPARGVRTISYGLGSWEAKRLRGCELTALSAAGLRLATARDGGGSARAPASSHGGSPCDGT